jgi:AraC family transcriptional regulator of arabinose operon
VLLKAYEFTIDKPLEYVCTGKFEALSPNWIHETADLTDYELFVISKGPLYISYQNQDYTVNTGETLLLPPGQPPLDLRRGFKPSDCSFYWMHFISPHPLTPVIPEDGSPETLGYLTENNIRLLIPQYCRTLNTEKIIVLMKQLQDAVRSNYDRLTINYMTTLVMCEIHNQHLKQLNMGAPTKTQRQMFQDILDYIKCHIHENVRVSDIARCFGYNEKYLSHMFSSIAGLSLKRYIMKAKIDEANFMLTDTNMTILEISSALGFADSHNFMKFYKKLTGLTPSEYRNAFSKRMLFHQ